MKTRSKMRWTCVLVLTALLSACGGGTTTPDAPPAEPTTAPAEGADGTAETETGDPSDAQAEAPQTNEQANEPADGGALPATGSDAPVDVAAPPADATTTDSGLAYKVLREGTGQRTPEPTDVVRVHYAGWTTDGEKFDSSYDRGEPAEFPLNKVIAGWTEGVSMMKEGEKRRLWIPESLAYKGSPGKPAGMLVFDVELLEIL